MAVYHYVTVPAGGERVQANGGAFVVPDQPIIPFIEGDGTGGELAMESAICKKTVTHDLARQMPGATEVSTSGFGDAIIAGMKGV